MEDALLQAHGLDCTVAGRVLWRDVNLSIAPGERWAISGASGSGKTLLLRSLAGLTYCGAGTIHLAGKSFADWWPPAYRARVVYLPQRPVLPEGTVTAALAAPFKLRVHCDKTFSRDTACRYLGAMGVDSAFLEQNTNELSGGEAQIVAVTRALLIEPTILLLDEPTASLDATRVARVEAVIGEWLAGGRKRAYVWSSHDTSQLERVSDRVLSL